MQALVTVLLLYISPGEEFFNQVSETSAWSLSKLLISFIDLCFFAMRISYLVAHVTVVTLVFLSNLTAARPRTEQGYSRR